MLLVQGWDGRFYGEPCAQLDGGGHITMDEMGCVVVLPKVRARSVDGAVRACKRVFKTLNVVGAVTVGAVRCEEGVYCGRPGWIIPFELEDWINPARFEYRCTTAYPSLNTPFIGFRMVFGKQVLIDTLGLERVPPLLTLWLTPGPGYIRRSREDYLALVAALTPLLPNYTRYKSIESYLESCPNQITIDRRRKSRRVPPKVESVGEPAGEECRSG